MKKKLLAVALAVIMVFTTMSAAVFAEEGQKTYPNLTAEVYLDNLNCIHYEDADVSVKITKESMEPITVSLKYYDEY